MHSPESSVAAHLETTSTADAAARCGLLFTLAACRRALGESQRKIALRMRTQQSAVCELEQGGSDPRVSTIHKYARALGFGMRLLIYLSPDPAYPHASPEQAWGYYADTQQTFNYTPERWTYQPAVEQSSPLADPRAWLASLADLPYEPFFEGVADLTSGATPAFQQQNGLSFDSLTPQPKSM